MRFILRCFMIIGLTAFIAALIVPAAFVHAQAIQSDENIWKVYDIVEPTADQVKWTETGTIGTHASWIADGTWIVASMRQSLVNQNDIFVSLYELFDWGSIRSTVESYYGVTFNSYNDFANAIQANPDPWLSLSWQMDTQWYGISQNTTKVEVSYNQTSDHVSLSIWFHITRVPEYLSGDKVTNWLTGFDLTPISVGNMKLWELWEDWTDSGTGYNLQFEAPANILTQNGDNYTCTLDVATSCIGKAFYVDQVIDVNMPPETITKALTPVELSVSQGNNVGSFVLMHGDLYPSSFTVMSAPPTQSMATQILTAWFTTPAGLGATASLIVLSYTALRGRRVYRRNSTYHRLYRSMVTLFDLYSRDLARFQDEMHGVSKTVFKMMVDDKINDDQFEKLLKRRDDLLERAAKEALPPPPKL